MQRKLHVFTEYCKILRGVGNFIISVQIKMLHSKLKLQTIPIVVVCERFICLSFFFVNQSKMYTFKKYIFWCTVGF